MRRALARFAAGFAARACGRLPRWRQAVLLLMVGCQLLGSLAASAAPAPTVDIPIQTASPPNACSILPPSTGPLLASNSATVLCTTKDGGTVTKSSTPTAEDYVQFAKGFVAGVLEGLWQQVSGLWGLLGNLGGLWQLAQDLMHHTRQTLQAIASALGKSFETVWHIRQELVCEPYAGAQTTGVLLVTAAATLDGEGVVNDVEQVLKTTSKDLEDVAKKTANDTLDLTVVNVGDEAKNVGEALAKGRTVITKDLKALSGNVVGDIGEGFVKGDLEKQGYTEVVQIQNAQGHGVDIIAHNPETGEVKVIEVKTTRKSRSLSLSKKQRMGGKKYTEDHITEARKGNYGPDAKAQAQKAKEWIQDAKGNITYEAQQVRLFQGDGGVVTAKIVKTKPW